MLLETELEWLFYQLWTKADARPTIFSFVIPDTVIYKNGEPKVWYFNNKDGSILKKNFQNVTNRKLYKTLVKQSAIDSAVSTTYQYA
jgi:hypothetical protein